MALSPRVFRWLPRAWRPAELWQRNLLVMTVAAGANHTGFDLINPFLPLFVLELGESDFGSAARWSGLLVGITPFMTAFVGPGWGALADRFGRKRVALVVMGSYVIILALMSTVGSLLQLLAFRTLIGLMGGFTTVAIVLATTGIPRERVGQAVGSLQSVNFVALAAIPPIGGLVVDHFGVRSNCAAGAFFCLIGLLLVVFGYRLPSTADSGWASPVDGERRPVEETPPAVREERHPGSSSAGVLRLPGFLGSMVILFGAQFVERSFFTVVPLFVALLLGSGEGVGTATGLVLGLGALATAVSANLYGRLSISHSLDRLLGLALVGGLVLVLPVVLVANIESLAILRIILALVSGGATTLAFTRAGRELPAGRSATGFSLLSSSSMMGGAVSPFLVGLLASVNLRAVFLVDALLFAIALAVILRALAGHRQRSPA